MYLAVMGALVIVYVSVGLYPRGRDDRVILVPKFVASGNKTQGP
jgi:hypothetical protein